jgi:hypothetical protein
VLLSVESCLVSRVIFIFHVDISLLLDVHKVVSDRIGRIKLFISSFRALLLVSIEFIHVSVVLTLSVALF